MYSKFLVLAYEITDLTAAMLLFMCIYCKHSLVVGVSNFVRTHALRVSQISRNRQTNPTTELG